MTATAAPSTALIAVEPMFSTQETARLSRVPGRLHRPDPPGIRAGPAPVRRLVPAEPCPPVPGAPCGHRMLRPRPRSKGPGPGHGHPQAVHRRGVLQVRRRGRTAEPLPGDARPPPRLDYESHATGLDRNEVGALLVAAGLGAAAEHALISLLALNGLRVSEATGADIQALGVERGHRTLTITRKGGKIVTIPLAPRTARAVDLAIGERCEGPIFLTRRRPRWTRTVPGGSSAGSPAAPGSPRPSACTRSGTPSSPPPK